MPSKFNISKTYQFKTNEITRQNVPSTHIERESYSDRDRDRDTDNTEQKQNSGNTHTSILVGLPTYGHPVCALRAARVLLACNNN